MSSDSRYEDPMRWKKTLLIRINFCKCTVSFTSLTILQVGFIELNQLGWFSVPWGKYFISLGETRLYRNFQAGGTWVGILSIIPEFLRILHIVFTFMPWIYCCCFCSPCFSLFLMLKSSVCWLQLLPFVAFGNHQFHYHFAFLTS